MLLFSFIGKIQKVKQNFKTIKIIIQIIFSCLYRIVNLGKLKEKYFVFKGKKILVTVFM